MLRAGFIAPVIFTVLSSSEKAMVNSTSHLRNPRMGKISLMVSMWDLTVKIPSPELQITEF